MQSTPLIIADQSIDYEQKAVIIALAFAFVIAIGGLAAAAVVMCGWQNVKSTVMDFLHGRATIVCR